MKAITEIVGRYEERRNAFINAAEKNWLACIYSPGDFLCLDASSKGVIPVKALQTCY